MSLLQEQLEEMRKQTQGAGVTPEMVASAGSAPKESLLPRPQHWTEKAMEEDGKGKFFGKMLLGGFTGLTPLLFPEMIGSRERYKADLATYNDAQAMATARQAGRPHMDALSNDTTDDDLEALRELAMIHPDLYGSVLTNYEKDRLINPPEWQIVDANGYKIRVDKTGNHPSEYVSKPDSDDRVTGPLTESQGKRYSFFKRGAPRLRQLHELEDSGVTMDRSKVTQLKAQEAQDANGRSYIPMAGWEKWMSVTLSQEEREYLTAAMDSGMIALRDESGAAISAQEMVRQLDQTLMFSDYSDSAFENQRRARATKVEGFLGGMPDWVLNEFQDERDYITGYDYTRRPSTTDQPPVTTGSGKLPSMTQEDMTTYMQLMEMDEASGKRFLELIELQGAQQ